MNLAARDILFLQNRVAYTRDEQAYQKLFFHFYSSLFRLAVNFVHHNEIAEEIVSDTMMKIWDMGSKLAQVDNISAYLFTSVKNACLTHLSRNRPQSIAIDGLAESMVADHENNPEKRLLRSEIEQKIETAVTSLPVQCQLVYRLIREEGCSHKQVAAILEISRNTIETHMRIALKKIKLALDDYLETRK